jgi:thioredoxin-dependent peroxiredoxin
MLRRLLLALPLGFAVTALLGCGATTRPDGGTGPLPVGSTPPDLSAVDQHGKTHRLSEERGHPTIVYFYPKDGTPGCTNEACAFRDAWEKYQKASIQVLGVSSDDQKSHEEFAKEEKLPFPILADTELTWAKAFGVPIRLGMTSRVSFLLNKDGKIAKVYPDVDPGVHANEVLTDAGRLD